MNQEAKRRASGDHEAIRTEKDNIRTEDLLEEMYGGFEEKEDSDNSQSSDGKILASTQGNLDYIFC